MRRAFFGFLLLASACGQSSGSSPSDVPGGGASGSGTSPSGSAGVAATSSGGSAGSSSPGGSGGGAVTPVGGAGGNVGTAGSTQGGAAVADTSDELYDGEKLPRFDIDLSPEAEAALGQAPDVYAHATLRYGSEKVADIGLRIKGEASQRTLQEKAAFKLKFDEFVKDQTFHGLRRMTFNNMVEDPSFLAERMAYHFFRSQKLPAPRCNSALIYVNDEFFGVYANIEAEDKTFLRRWFASDAGNLYEEGQVDFEPGNEMFFDLETNETKNDRSDLTATIAALGAAKDQSFLDDVGTQVDAKHFLAFTAAEAAVNQWDMYGYTCFYPNNFRIYRDPAQQKFVFLPWGMDMSMKPFRDSGKPHIAPLELAHQGDQDFAPVSSGLIFQRCLASATCKSQYIDVVKSTADAYEKLDLETLAKHYHEQIAASVAADTRKEYTADEIEAAYQSLLKVVRERPEALRMSLAQ